jgi:hypothetical protein
MAAKSLENLLNPSKDGEFGELAHIVRRARDMGELATALARSLPPEEGASILAANVRDDGELVILCSSSAWASRLRFAADALLAAARTQGADVSRCSVRVARSQ